MQSAKFTDLTQPTVAFYWASTQFSSVYPFTPEKTQIFKNEKLIVQSNVFILSVEPVQLNIKHLFSDVCLHMCSQAVKSYIQF